MLDHTPARLMVVVCALAFGLTTGAGVASAEPDVTPFVNTTCTYSQVEAALNALSPDAAREFEATPMAQTWMHAFLDSSAEKRRQLIETAPPELQRHTALGVAMAATCKNYPPA